MKAATEIARAASTDAEEQLKSFLDKFDPNNQALIRAARIVLRKRLATANELVYVVDDDRRVREALSTLLRANGRDVQAFDSGGEFLDTRRRNVVACLILDMSMPGMNGLEVLARLKELGSTAPVVVVTAEADVATAEATFLNGAVNFITKPIDPAEVIGRVQEALSVNA